MTEQMYFDGYYAGLFYSITVDGTKYCIYEYTPVLHHKHIIKSGSSFEKGRYNDDYVIDVIKGLLPELPAVEDTSVQLRLPLEEVM